MMRHGMTNRNLFCLINRFFKYGIQSIDILQFDCGLKQPLLTIKKAKTEIKELGRGGTNFQPIIDYFEKARKPYDGLIIFTDGYAPQPEMKTNSIRKCFGYAAIKRIISGIRSGW